MLSARILAAAAALLAMGLKPLPLVSSTESVLSAKDLARGGDATSSLDLPRLRRVRSTVGGGGSTATSQQQEEKDRYPLLERGFEQTIVEEERDEGEGGGVVQPLIIGGNRASADDYRFYVQCNGCGRCLEEVEKEISVIFLSPTYPLIDRSNHRCCYSRRFASFLYCIPSGATLIAPDMILSAAHCAKKIRRNSKVLVGAFKDWDPDTSGARFHLVEKTEKNPNYNDNEEYDFLVAKLKTPVENPVLVKLNRNVNVPQAAERLKVVGLGQIEDGEYPTYLQEVHVRVLTDSRCRSSYPDGWVTGMLTYSHVSSAMHL